jgi:hypothetical protein
MTFEIVDPTIQDNRMIAAFIGASGSGKTLSSLIFATGFLGGLNIDPEKNPIVLIDTELRSSTYLHQVGQLVAPFKVIKFDPPYTPQRYMEAYKKAQEYIGDKNGFVIIDSLSNGWDDEGGVVDIAENGKSTNSFANYKEPKIALSKLMNKIYKSKNHVICCLKTKQSMIMNGSRPTGVYEEKAIAEKGYKYYFTTTVWFEENSKFARFDKNPLPYQHCGTYNKRISLDTGKCFSEAMQGKITCDNASDDWKLEIEQAQSINELTDISKKYKNHPDSINLIRPALTARKIEIINGSNKDFSVEEPNLKEVNNATTEE